MKQTRLAVIVLLIAMCAFSWFLVGRKLADTMGNLQSLIDQGHSYQERGLYEKAIESYNNAIAQSPSRELYDSLVQSCESYYQERPTNAVENTLLAAYNAATAAYPDEVSYWERYVQIYLDDSDFSKAVDTLRQAERENVSSDTLSAQWVQAYYSVKEQYQKYESITPLENEDAYTVQTGDLYGAVNSSGSEVVAMNYSYTCPVGEDGVVLCSTVEGEVQIFDADGVMIGRFPGTVEEARAYSEDLIPARLQGRQDWCYLDLEGNEVLSGYQQAGCFQDGTAAVQLDTGEWCLIGKDGTQTSDTTWENVRLDPMGRWMQDDVMLIQTDGSWKIADHSGEIVEGFTCEGIDFCSNGEPIAFCQAGQWGFVNTDGTVLIQPAYESAHSFSGGVAAIYVDGSWDFIDTQGNVVVDGNFADTGYFSPESGTCPVLENEDAPEWHLIVWSVAH
ncbi:WG repeat-containing protein [uncultured Gemmiger sp.]|uniref:WG repeat-containing protein n=1 Tax=uncultured Gemmiger sp. TaxID=1623490 RepID=UPI0025F9D130|nr:WG repeat-containing protein [uncultured Gemmiger sp.]